VAVKQTQPAGSDEREDSNGYKRGDERRSDRSIPRRWPAKRARRFRRFASHVVAVCNSHVDYLLVGANSGSTP
jgi:hypothetical protein